MERHRLDTIIDGLNPPQREAVEHRGSPLLLLAGAGSGKTRVITVRIAHLVAHELNPEDVLALTFTNKAAGEMAERVGELVGQDAARQLTVGTFHSLGLRMLEEEGPRVGLARRFALIDAADQATGLRQCLRTLRLDPQRHDPRVFLTAISRLRNAGLEPDDVAREPARRLTARVYRAYLEWLSASEAIDFDDLILRPVRFLAADAELREKWQQRFRAVLVDEYQDTNATQLELVRLLAGEHGNVCVVGDDDQSIYGWRGACIENILEFERTFPDARTIKLTQNYRSTGHILACANGVIGHNASRREKELWTAAGEGEPVRVVTCKDNRSEASFVAGQIHRLHEDLGLAWSEFGILFRASAQAADLEEALRLAGVPYRLVGAYDFFERKEVRDMLSYLRLVDNPRDRASLTRIINFPQRGIGPASLAALQTHADARSLSPYRAMAEADGIPGLKSATALAMKGLHALIEEARATFEEHGDLAAVVELVCERTRAREAWIRDVTQGPGGQSRWRHVEALLESMRHYQARKGRVRIRDYLQLVALDSKRNQDEEGRDAVALMTMHGAKGLEWPVCFLIGCEEGLLPHQRVVDERGDISEERRLFYVAMTRARRRLFLTLARSRRRYHGSSPTRPSRFLAEIPAEHRVAEDRSHGEEPASKDETRARFEALMAHLGRR